MDAIGSLDDTKAINTRDQYGLTPWQTAKIYGYQDIATELILIGADSSLSWPSPDSIAIQRVEQLLGDKPTHGVAILVAKDGKVLINKALGNANSETSLTTDHVFRIGSVTKQFTAAGIMHLIKDGKISLEDRLSKFFPDFPKGDQVTVYQLLTHTSGIHSYTDDEDFVQEASRPVDLTEIIDRASKTDYNFEPGTDWSYNNSAYYMLGAIIEQVSGKSYEAYLREKLWSPAGMKSTGVYENTSPPSMEVTGFSWESDSLAEALNWDMTWAGGAGNMYATAHDLFKWNDALFSGKILSQNFLKTAHIPARLNNGEKPEEIDYGFGWMMSESRGKKVIGHSGGLHGFLSNLAYYPELNATIVVLSNCLPAKDVDPSQLTTTLANIYLWDKLNTRKSKQTATMTEAINLDEYLGTYAMETSPILTISKEEEQLYVQLTGQDRFPVFYKGVDSFFLKVVDAMIVFERNDQGEVTGLINHQNSRKVKASRFQFPEVTELSEKELKRYAGNYKGDGLEVTIMLDKQRLFLKVKGQSAVPIYPESSNHFFLKMVKAELVFEGKKKKEALSLYQAGRTFNMKRQKK